MTYGIALHCIFLIGTAFPQATDCDSYRQRNDCKHVQAGQAQNGHAENSDLKAGRLTKQAWQWCSRAAWRK